MTILVFHGATFVFRVGSSTVRVWGSSFTGIERVYVDDVLASERQTFRIRGEHRIQVANEQYAVSLETRPVLGIIRCSLLRSNGTAIARSVAKFNHFRATLALGASLLLVSPLIVYFQLSIAITLVLGSTAILGSGLPWGWQFRLQDTEA